MMKKYLMYAFRLLLVIGVSFSYFVGPVSVKAKQATTIAELKEYLSELQSQKRNQQNAKSQTQSEINAKKNNIYNAYQEKERVSNEVEEAKNKITEAESNIEKASTDIKNVLKYYQVTNNNNEYYEYITNASTTTELIMRITAVEQITTYYKKRIETLKNLIVEKQNLQVELNEKNKELDSKIDNYSDALSELNDKLDQIDELTLDIDEQIKAQQSTIKYYQSICDSETQLLSTCTKDPQSFGWLKPTVKGRLSSGWGYRSFNGGSFHNGVDIAGNPEGTPEYAAAAGRVAFTVSRSSCGGNRAYILVTVNGVKYTLEYAHMLTINVRAGQTVTTDTVIGTVGGYSTSTHYSRSGYDSCAYGAHLHFGVAKGWYTVDYNKWSSFIANNVNPPGFPSIGSWWYKR